MIRSIAHGERPRVPWGAPGARAAPGAGGVTPTRIGSQRYRERRMGDAEPPRGLGHSEQKPLDGEGRRVGGHDRSALIQLPDKAIKKTILDFFAIKGTQTVRTFDLVRTNHPAPPLNAANIGEYLPEIRLCEIKSTKAPIKNSALNGFFFGATETEYNLARALGAHYLFLFVVLNPNNDFGRPFFVPLTLAQVENRTRVRSIQYQVNFRSDMTVDESALGDWVSYSGHGGIEVWPYQPPP
jgi:hypothetical protein